MGAESRNSVYCLLLTGTLDFTFEVTYRCQYLPQHTSVNNALDQDPTFLQTTASALVISM